MSCPNCGFKQDGGEECLRCGVIFARYHTPGAPHAGDQPEERNTTKRKTLRLFRQCCQMFTWFSLVLSIPLLILILRPSHPPQVTITPDAVRRAEYKIREFQSSTQQGREHELQMDESELNGWLSTNLAIGAASNETSAGPGTSHERLLNPAGLNDDKPEASENGQLRMRQVQSAVRDIKIRLEEDSLRVYVAFDLYGKNMSLELDGRLLTHDGHLLLEPSSGKLGSLPLPAGTLAAACQRLFESPENKDKFSLPPDIRDVRVEHGQLIISPR